MNDEMAFLKELLKKSFGRMWVHEFAVPKAKFCRFTIDMLHN
jgi:hypothetical protein